MVVGREKAKIETYEKINNKNIDKDLSHNLKYLVFFPFNSNPLIYLVEKDFNNSFKIVYRF